MRAALLTERRVVVLGESFSGPIAIRIAVDPPAGLVVVVLYVTFARPQYQCRQPDSRLCISFIDRQLQIKPSECAAAVTRFLEGL